MNLFKQDVECSDVLKEILSIQTKKYPKMDLVDLRPKSTFSQALPIDIFMKYNSEFEKKHEGLIPNEIHKFLSDFLSRDLSVEEWLNQIDDLRASNQDPLLIALVRIIRGSMPQFVRAISLGIFNPLLGISRSHLNSFVHPCIEATLWHIAKVNYEFGEMSTANHTKKDKIRAR
ncbi:hypothetical protein RclHR1_18170004 [Rhizophagus clarus]|uniref:Uncharacterized protein n=1 Tax=Rhizophagus clarus TaxID=94130 RepID=A0A2Z6REZ6_9GLOM|nr:hypothetical protein RclHR1_18170004 [Rhizophagus clarus]